MFKKPKFLNKEEDKGLKLEALKNYKHTRRLNFCSIAREEVVEASKDYPIFFIKEGEDIVPIAILGLKENENLFVNKQGEWVKEKYIPALARCYPFAISKNQLESKEVVVTVVYDSEYEGINNSGEAVFDSDSELTEYGKSIMDFIQRLFGDFEATKEVLKPLTPILKNVDANVDVNGHKFVLQGLYQIDTEKLNTLDDETLLAMLKSGIFSLVYAHLASMSNFGKLANRI
jgi:hypothetical protein